MTETNSKAEEETLKVPFDTQDRAKIAAYLKQEKILFPGWGYTSEDEVISFLLEVNKMPPKLRAAGWRLVRTFNALFSLVEVRLDVGYKDPEIEKEKEEQNRKYNEAEELGKKFAERFNFEIHPDGFSFSGFHLAMLPQEVRSRIYIDGQNLQELCESLSNVSDDNQG